MAGTILFQKVIALKKKRPEDPQEFTITLQGIDIDEVGLIQLRGKKLKIVVEEGCEQTPKWFNVEMARTHLECALKELGWQPEEKPVEDNVLTLEGKK